MYNILECRIEFKNHQLFRVTVLVEISRGDVRAICADTKPKAGYMFFIQRYRLFAPVFRGFLIYTGATGIPLSFPPMGELKGALPVRSTPYTFKPPWGFWEISFSKIAPPSFLKNRIVHGYKNKRFVKS